ncbi:L-tyrosine decarboxylase-like [Hydractinia symbiolongicarpus]|uniref:L-tyrosine decarboxylase-like n=1 Tax=Hydractinia symbiolongicarpus TaxID=13093 RepID=UPI00254ADD2B|nr:L-tyrosine decarboxylase-like [Hydractinia symbiolongicarpus]
MAEKRKRHSLTPGKGKRPRQGECSGTVFDPLPQSDCYKKPWEALGAWFLGPRAENREVFSRLISKAIEWYADCREGYFPGDPCYIDSKVKGSKAYQSEIADTENQLKIMHDELSTSTPFFSTRYQGHMLWENTMPSMLGYFSGMLWNQNNVDSTISPVTTQYEIDVGQHLCQLMNFENDEKVSPWGHITGCGSIANLESLWAARNLKFHPLAVQAVVMSKNAGKLAVAADTPVYIPQMDSHVELSKCTKWQLLNLDVDTVCNLSGEVCDRAGVDKKVLEEKLKSESVINIGMTDFMQKHKILKTPVVCSPGTFHYSWPKSATVLGIGDQYVLPVHVDGNARQDMKELDLKLAECLKRKQAVFMVVAVIGTTEEGAVDPLDEIVAMRDKYRAQGLNYAIHADAAWGGYMLTMIQPPSEERRATCEERGEDFVPAIPLSDYAKKQYQTIKHADTVTIDPHKAGLCLYPAGALCYRNGTMKDLITLAATEVFHGDNDISVGVYGLEGSKPGAAAAGVLLSHRVIGLDQMGYGRILGQCQLLSKLFYCMWMTVAQDYDDWVCVNFIDLPELPPEFPQTEEEQKDYIRTRILGRDNEELAQDEEAMRFLRIVGPDALINTCAVNLIGNSDNLEAMNQLQNDIFDETNAGVGKNPKRVPIFLTTSTYEREKYGESLDQFKHRLGISADGNLDFLRNTCMSPFEANDLNVVVYGKLFRNVVLNCIGGLEVGGLGDPKVHHTFVVAGKADDEHGRVFLDYIPSFSTAGKQYHVVLSMLPATDTDRDRLRNAQRNQLSTFYLKTKGATTMKNFLRSDNTFMMEVYKGTNANKICDVTMKVDEVFRYFHLESLQASEHIEYPEHQKYFLYGDTKRAFISHVPTKSPDFHQVIELDELPHSVTPEMLDLGVIITIPEIPGRPLEIRGSIADPLQRDTYTVSFKGVQYADCETTITFANQNAKKYFNGNI